VVYVVLYGYFVGADRAHEALLVQYAEARRRRKSLPFHFFKKKPPGLSLFFLSATCVRKTDKKKGAEQAEKAKKRAKKK
jgi:hypothetical protein